MAEWTNEHARKLQANLELIRSMTSEELEREFESVRQDFFPRWDRGRQWKIEKCTQHPEDDYPGYCERGKKVISVYSESNSWVMYDLKTLLIHEICHAVTRGTHGVEFIRRLRKARDRAKEIRRMDLAESLEKEIIGIEEDTGVRSC